jgi:toxin-antitoxin system PIN domain toxin
MSPVALLDVNVLVALFDPDHVHHDLAHDWFADHRRHGWATCPVTENGFVRVLSNPAYGSPVARAAELIERLRTFCASGSHTFWPDDVSLTDASLFDPSLLAGSRHVTDVYLLGLAARRGGCLATFDRTIPLAAARGATPRTLQVIAPLAPGT